MPIDSSRFLYEDDHLLAVSKRSKELSVQGAGPVDKLPLFDLLKADHPGLRVLHRLDFETSGVMVFSKTKEAYDAVRDTDFAQWRKVYVALVMGRVGRKEGVIRKRLPARSSSRDERSGPGPGSCPKQKFIDATTRYVVLEKYVNSSLVEVEIETGRHHQIRRHFASINHPLVLDRVYGHAKFNSTFTQEFSYRDFFLHAQRVELLHPVTGERLVIEAGMPKAFREVLQKLRG